MMMMSMIINLDAKFGGGRFEKRKPSLEFGGEMGEGGMVKEKNKKTSTPSLEEVEHWELEDLQHPLVANWLNSPFHT